MKTLESIKTIDIHTYTWFDRTYGNTYFAQEIVINYAMSDETTVINPFQYGYSSYRYEAFKFLEKLFGFPEMTINELKANGDIIVRDTELSAKKSFLNNLGK